MFGDLVGFTAWSSLREPSQVFTLMETIYASFDENAAQRNVFKVETIGDCYVAVCGLPTPRKDHCVVMARFADECLKGMGEVLQGLAVQLGPDTLNLGIRIGLHRAGGRRSHRQYFFCRETRCVHLCLCLCMFSVLISPSTYPSIFQGKTERCRRRLLKKDAHVNCCRIRASLL